MMEPVYIVDIFRDVVAATQNAVISKKNEPVKTLLQSLQEYDTNITGIHYQHGHPLEIIETLEQQTQGTTQKFKRFPLVALFQDFPEEKGRSGFDSETTLHILICYGTKNTYKATQRYEKTFKPVLYPIYLELLEQIRLDSRFNVVNTSLIEHTKIDRLYWGRETDSGNKANKFNDLLDCIELKNLKLKLDRKIC